MTPNTNIDGHPFCLEEFDDGWAWESKDGESRDFFLTREAAEEDARRYLREMESERLADEEEKMEDRLYGTYQKQVEVHWNSTR
jgi:hypothetical protein